MNSCLEALSFSGCPLEILGESHRRVLTEYSLAFLVSFNMLIHQNVCRKGSRLFFWLVLFLKNVIEEGPARSGMCKPFAPTCPWLGKTKPCGALAGCKLLNLLGFVYLFCLSFPYSTC